MSKKKRKKSNKIKKKPNKSLRGDITYILFEDPAVSNRLNILYRMLNNSKKGSEIFKEIEEKLNEVTRTKETDSYSFYIYSKNLVSVDTKVAVPNFEKFINRGPLSMDFPKAIYLLLLFREYHKGGHTDIRNLEKYKLLYSSVRSMGDRFIRAIVDCFRDMEDEYIDEGLEKLDWSQLKDRFIKATMLKEKSAAFKILGRLSNLDPGESYYFEALAHYNNEEYDDAIRFGKKVTSDNIDYSQAFSIILKSYALKGDFENFTNTLISEDKIKINIFYLLHLMQILICNTNNIVEVLNDINKKLEQYKPKQSIAHIGEHIDSKRGLFRNSCKLALERMELLEEMDLYADEMDDDEIPDELGHRFIQVGYALQTVPELAEILGTDNITKEELSQMVLQVLLENYEPEFEDFYLALIIQLKLNQKTHFIDNINSNAERLLLYRDERAWELIEAAYVESIILGNMESRLKLSKILESAGRLDNRKLDKYVTNNMIKNGLSKEGQIAYESAEWQYHKAIAEDYGWKDAGMISLSYFRIIEVEINVKFIIPAIKLIGASNIRKLYENIIAQREGKVKEDIESKWSSLIYSFENIEKGKLQGLTLESIEWLFGMIKSKSLKKNKLDYDLRKLVYDNIIQFVKEPEGIEAIDNGKICEFVNYTNRNRYRNPPAHTRYLHISVAKECRELVEKNLIQLFTWV